MTESPRWERESEEDLRPATQPDPTDEYEVQAPAREPRLAAVRESFAEALAAARESLGDSLSAARETLSDTASRVGRWFASLDRRPDVDAHFGRDPIAEIDPPAEPGFELGAPAPGPRAERFADGEPDVEDAPATARFPTAALGYNRQAVDRHLAALERELDRLHEAVDPPVSITEEIERLGEQTASILVVAHDKAHETAREAQARAARAVSDAARNAERMTAEAQLRLRELDEETDAVWRERERLLDDVRVVSSSLASLAQDAGERFPAAAPAAVAAGVVATEGAVGIDDGTDRANGSAADGSAADGPGAGESGGVDEDGDPAAER